MTPAPQPPAGTLPAPDTAWQQPAPRDSDCQCGHPLEPCRGCRVPRCLACDPYRSDDCTGI